MNKEEALKEIENSVKENRKANLRKANLWKVNLENANLRKANLWKVNLENADLRNADLRKADLRKADLRKADLENADLRNADLRNANLWNADLENADLEKAIGLPDQKSILDKMFKKRDDRIIGYKVFGLYYKPNPKWEIKEGSIIEETCDTDRRNNCSCGISFATKEWIERENKGEKTIWEISASEKDIVVPYATDGNVRASKVRLEKKVNNSNGYIQFNR